jgi:hypothetical protein
VADPSIVDLGSQRLAYFTGVVQTGGDYNEQLGLATSSRTLVEIVTGTGFLSAEQTP